MVMEPKTINSAVYQKRAGGKILHWPRIVYMQVAYHQQLTFKKQTSETAGHLIKVVHICTHRIEWVN